MRGNGTDLGMDSSPDIMVSTHRPKMDTRRMGMGTGTPSMATTEASSNIMDPRAYGILRDQQLKDNIHAGLHRIHEACEMESISAEHACKDGGELFGRPISVPVTGTNGRLK